MQELIKKIIRDKYDTKFEEFIRTYLKEANTIGGFVVFPKHPNSINGRRGLSAKIRDRFDLTLECIGCFYNKIDNPLADVLEGNPLADVLEGDKEFFAMFGKGKDGFKKYIDFFCLNSWVSDGNVLSLIDDELLDNWDFNNDTPLPTKNNWQTFYKNIMKRLKDRNTDIQKLFGDKNK